MEIYYDSGVRFTDGNEVSCSVFWVAGGGKCGELGRGDFGDGGDSFFCSSGCTVADGETDEGEDYWEVFE